MQNIQAIINVYLLTPSSNATFRKGGSHLTAKKMDQVMGSDRQSSSASNQTHPNGE
jgi:hypothetical protein